MRWQTCNLQGIEEEMCIGFRERGIQEVERLKDVVGACRELGGEGVEEWARKAFGFIKDD